jgi:hypothetical protein
MKPHAIAQDHAPDPSEICGTCKAEHFRINVLNLRKCERLANGETGKATGYHRSSLRMRAIPGIEYCVVGRMRTALLIVGVLAIVVGLLWIGQGSGYFPYPRSSFMINEVPWIYRGFLLAVLGFIAVAGSRRH